jgi:hypothetical protein
VRFQQVQSPMNQSFLVHYDYRSKTALVECNDRSHVLAEFFADNESAKQAALRYAGTHWGYGVPPPTAIGGENFEYPNGFIVQLEATAMSNEKRPTSSLPRATAAATR